MVREARKAQLLKQAPQTGLLRWALGAKRARSALDDVVRQELVNQVDMR